MKFTQIPSDTFQKLQMNAGILVKDFDPTTGTVTDIIGATTGGISFTDAVSYTDFGEDIDNCPKNTMELKVLDSHEVTVSGTFVTVSASMAKMLAGAADIDADNETHIIPRNDITVADFSTLWWIGDYSNVNTGENAGYIAIKLFNALNTGGFSITSSDNAKGQFAFSFTGHYSIEAQDVVPYEIYVRQGGEEAKASILLNKHSLTINENDTATLTATTVPSGQTVTWTTANSSIADVVDGVVSGEGTGNTIITASITVDGVTYTDTCTVVVEAGV